MQEARTFLARFESVTEDSKDNLSDKIFLCSNTESRTKDIVFRHEAIQSSAYRKSPFPELAKVVETLLHFDSPLLLCHVELIS